MHLILSIIAAILILVAGFYAIIWLFVGYCWLEVQVWSWWKGVKNNANKRR